MVKSYFKAYQIIITCGFCISSINFSNRSNFVKLLFLKLEVSHWLCPSTVIKQKHPFGSQNCCLGPKVIEQNANVKYLWLLMSYIFGMGLGYRAISKLSLITLEFMSLEDHFWEYMA